MAKPRKTYTLDDAMGSVAKSLREFGYPDATAEKMREVFDAWEAGKVFPDLPHGILGAFASSQFDEVSEKLKSLPRSK
jgi:hypothetical protein